MPTHPLPKGSRWVRVIARIRLNATGEVREKELPAILDGTDAAPDYFIWSEGNYSCDCNRSIFFGDTTLNHARCCNSENKYSVELVNPVTKEVYYTEFDEG